MTHKKMIKKVVYVSASAALAGLAWFAVGASTAQDVRSTSDVTQGYVPTTALGANTAGVRRPESFDLNPALTNPGSALQAQAATAEDAIPALRARMRELQAALQKTPTSAAEQYAQQQTIAELNRLQMQLQQEEAAQGQYAAYRQARDAQEAMNRAALGPDMNLDPFGVQRGTSKQELLDASGLSGANLAERTSLGAFGGRLTPAEASLLREQKEGLAAQYRQLQQTLRALQPNEEALAASLREEQAVLLTQLKDIEAQLERAGIDPLDPTMQPNPTFPTNPIPGLQSNDFNAIPQQNQLNYNFAATDDLNARLQKANQAATLLREAGLPQLAGFVMAEIPRISADPTTFTETPLVQGTWASSQSLAADNNNPFQTVGPKDIEGINNSIDGLKQKIESLAATLADVETQLKLLTRQQVTSGYITPPTATPAETTTATVETTQPAADVNVDLPVEPVTPAAPATPALPDAPSAELNDPYLANPTFPNL